MIEDKREEISLKERQFYLDKALAFVPKNAGWLSIRRSQPALK